MSDTHAAKANRAEKPTYMLGLFSTTEGDGTPDNGPGRKHVYCALFSRNPNDPKHVVYQPIDFTGFDVRHDKQNYAERAWFMPLSAASGTYLKEMIDLIRMTAQPHHTVQALVGPDREALYSPVFAYGKEGLDAGMFETEVDTPAVREMLMTMHAQGHSTKEGMSRVLTTCRHFTLNHLIHWLGIPLDKMDAGLSPNAETTEFPAAFDRLVAAHPHTLVALGDTDHIKRGFDQAVVRMKGGCQSVIFTPHDGNTTIAIGIPHEIDKLTVNTPEGQKPLMDFILGQKYCAESASSQILKPADGSELSR